jgi:hypothetical protein
MFTQLDVAIAVLGLIFSGIVLVRAPKQHLKRVPLSGLLILGVFYALAGWMCAVYDSFWWVWFAAFVGSVASAIVPASDLGVIGLRSVVLAGIGGIVAVFTRNLAFEIARTLAIGLGILAAWSWAVGGARYRMEHSSLPRSFILWTLILVGWQGLWMGWLIDTFALPGVGAWLRQNLLI